MRTRTDIAPPWLFALAGAAARAVACVACVACVGCGVADPSPRGFGSRQILAIRDPQLDVVRFTADQARVYLGRYVQPRATIGLPPPYDLSTLELATGQREPVVPAVFQTVVLTGAAPTGESGGGRSLALLHYPSDADVPPDFASIEGPRPGHLQLSFVNETNGPGVQIVDVADRNPIRFGASESDPIVIDRFDAAENVKIWFGPPGAIESVRDGVTQILGFDVGGAFGLMNVPGFEPEIQHLPFGGGAGSVAVTANLGEFSVVFDESGTAIWPDPNSGGPRDPLYWCVPSASPEVPSRCSFVYARKGLNGGPRRLFVRARDDAREWVLPGEGDVLNASLGPKALLWTATGSTGNHLHSWSFGASRAGGCDVPPGLIEQAVWNAAQDQFAVSVAPAIDANGKRSPGVLVLGVPGGVCRVITPAPMYFFGWTFSPDGTALKWHDFPGGDVTVIHLTATDDAGTDRSIELPGTFFTSEFHGAGRLLLRRFIGDGASLSFIDLGEDPLRDHAIADRLASGLVWIDDRWLLLGDAHSSQDDTFTLRVVNIETGASRLVSSSVAGFTPAWTVRPAGATTLPIAYVVRGRASSAQDGVWLANLPLDDFRP